MLTGRHQIQTPPAIVRKVHMTLSVTTPQVQEISSVLSIRTPKQMTQCCFVVLLLNYRIDSEWVSYFQQTLN